jgi:hypothetical protein
MSSITDPQRLVELVAHTMFRDASERAGRHRAPRLSPDEKPEPRSGDPRDASPPR